MLPAVPAVAQTITTAAIEADETTPMIVPITGAPGDGNTALAAAIRNKLARVGLPISGKARGPKYRLDVHVTVGNARDDGNQPLAVRGSSTGTSTSSCSTAGVCPTA
jgi:adenylylsulfate kinase-like enzyme